ENAIQHNLGTEKKPVFITIRIDKNLTVSNNVIQKRNTRSPSGKALKNLNEQYFLLTESQIKIQHTNDQFSVNIPIIPEA
ncbi:MAG TPA: histidine kinase, partial [Chryseobacterium sp.]